MTLIRPRDNIPEWPYSRAQLAADEPRLSLTYELPEHELRSLEALGVYVYRVASTDQPAADPRTERVEETTPIKVDGVWTQQWTVRQATPEEIASYDAANAPVPRWVQFGVTLGSSPEVNQFVATVREVAPVLHLMIGVGLGQAAQGDAKTFLAAWGQAMAAGLIPAELLAGVVAMASGFDLPAEFIAALQSPPSLTPQPPEP